METAIKRDTQGSLSHGGLRGLGEADAGVTSTRVGRCLPAQYGHVAHDCQPDFDGLDLPDKIFRMTREERKTIRIPVLMTPSELSALDDWAFANRVRSRGEAIRRLIEAGIRALDTKRPAGNKSKSDKRYT